MSDHCLLLLDSMCLVYRAFYAIKNLSTRDGRPTNAIFGFVRMVDQLRDAHNPTHWAAVFDGGLPEERMELLKDYKAQRPETPDDLQAQVGPIETYLDAAGIRRVRMDGEEADDVMAAMAAQAAGEGYKVLLATADKDLYQMVDDRVLLVPVSSKGKVLDEEGVRAKTGVAPRQIVDWLSLVGDSVDNIPGVPGIGAKRAAALLQEFGDIENLWQGLDRVASDRMRSALVAHRGVVERNRRMIRLRTDLPMGCALEAFKRKEGDPGRLLAFFEEWELHSMARQIREQDLF